MSQPMTANTNAGDGETYGDIIGCISQYFFEGWKYRVSLYGKGGTEPYEKVRKEANEAAHRMLDPYLEAHRQAAVANCDVAEEQPNSVHIKFFNEGVMAGRTALLDELETDIKHTVKVLSIQGFEESAIANGQYVRVDRLEQLLSQKRKAAK